MKIKKTQEGKFCTGQNRLQLVPAKKLAVQPRKNEKIGLTDYGKKT